MTHQEEHPAQPIIEHVIAANLPAATAVLRFITTSEVPTSEIKSVAAFLYGGYRDGRGVALAMAYTTGIVWEAIRILLADTPELLELVERSIGTSITSTPGRWYVRGADDSQLPDA
jgi:hypothetical protein